MKYYLFAYPEYYPSGGMSDYLGAYDSLEEAGHFIVSRQNHRLYDDTYELATIQPDGELAVTYEFVGGEWRSYKPEG